MNITVFGATGATGREVVTQALANGHHVTAFARTPANVPMNEHPQLTIVQGDATKATDIARAITEETEVVISTLGHRRGDPQPNLLTNATQAIISTMQQHQVKRLILQSGAGCWIEGKDNPGLLEHVVRFALKTFSGHVLEDSERMVATVMNSGLDWTIPRAPRMVEGDHTSTYRVGYLGNNAGTTISFADFADFIVKELDNNANLCESPVISY
ncbi:MAG: SDR family oxidoreductase [Chloroflexota bacterium]